MKNTNKCLKLGLATVIIFCLAVTFVHASAYDLPDQDAFAVGRGMAVVATADNPSAIYFNPAGITQIQGDNLRVGVYGIYLDPNYKSPTTGNTYENQDTLHAIPQLFYTHTTADSMVSYGFGFYSPFGLGLKWPQNADFRTLGTESSLSSATLNPIIAFKLSPTLSIAGGVTFNYAMADLRLGLPTGPTDTLRFDGSGWDIGYNLGLRWQPHEKVSIGITYRSATSYNLKGHTEDSVGGGALTERTSAQAELPVPADVVFGISYRPTPKWNLEFDAERMDWSSVRTLTVHQSQPTAISTGFGQFQGNSDISLPLYWQTSWYYEFGVTRYLDNNWSVSVGYIYNENSTPDAHYTPLVADMDKHFFSLGVGHKGKKMDFDIAYQFGYGTTTVSGGTAADGRYEFISHAIAASCTWHF